MRGIWWRCSSAPSPMPDSCSSCGLATAPADRMISRRAAKRWRCPSMSTSTRPARRGSGARRGWGGGPRVGGRGRGLVLWVDEQVEAGGGGLFVEQDAFGQRPGFDGQVAAPHGGVQVGAGRGVAAAVAGGDVVGALAPPFGPLEVVVAGVAEAGAGGEEGLANGVHGVAGDADFAAAAVPAGVAQGV